MFCPISPPKTNKQQKQGIHFNVFCLLQAECDLEKGLEMRKWVLSGILASEETYLSHLEALLLVSARAHMFSSLVDQ